MATAGNGEAEDEDYFLAPQDQRVFGAGIKRKRIDFVPASTTESSITKPATSLKVNDGGSVGARYLAIVLQKQTRDEKEADKETQPEKGDETRGAKDMAAPEPENNSLCLVCKQPLASPIPHGDDGDGRSTPHESSLAHQVCLSHVRPPSHFDRSHVGVRYLSSYGWDVDSGTGLGAQQDGIRIPIKTREKNDTVGLRERVDDDDDAESGSVTGKRKKRQGEWNRENQKENAARTRMNAKQVRLQEAEGKRRAERIRRILYGPDLEKYLGSGG